MIFTKRNIKVGIEKIQGAKLINCYKTTGKTHYINFIVEIDKMQIMYEYNYETKHIDKYQRINNKWIYVIHNVMKLDFLTCILSEITDYCIKEYDKH